MTSFRSMSYGGRPGQKMNETMNKYGAMAARHWHRWLPSRVAALPDPERFFKELGEEAEERITYLAEAIASGGERGESYMDRVGRRNMAWLRAEEAVLPEMILLAPEEEGETEEVD